MIKLELIELGEKLIELADEYGDGLGKCLKRVIEDAPSTAWHPYPENKPEKDGEYLVKQNPSYEYNALKYAGKDIFATEFEGGKFYYRSETDFEGGTSRIEILDCLWANIPE